MSPRPRKASDDEVFAAATRVMARCGPAALTLAMIASEAGLTAGALVQRFGSKRALLLALSERFARSTDQLFAGLRSASPSPIAALRAYGEGMAGLGTSATALANNLSWLQQDLTDPLPPLDTDPGAREPARVAAAHRRRRRPARARRQRRSRRAGARPRSHGGRLADGVGPPPGGHLPRLGPAGSRDAARAVAASAPHEETQKTIG
jgi:AcrR family transcriptional regulator